jgi:hypothetical protein
MELIREWITVSILLVWVEACQVERERIDGCKVISQFTPVFDFSIFS